MELPPHTSVCSSTSNLEVEVCRSSRPSGYPPYLMNVRILFVNVSGRDRKRVSRRDTFRLLPPARQGTEPASIQLFIEIAEIFLSFAYILPQRRYVANLMRYTFVNTTHDRDTGPQRHDHCQSGGGRREDEEKSADNEHHVEVSVKTEDTGGTDVSRRQIVQVL